MVNIVGEASGERAALSTLGALVIVALLIPAPAVAEPRMCTFIAGIAGDEELDALSARCHAGDVLVGVVDERSGSLLSYAARLCDFTQQIVTYRHPDPSRTQNVFTCVFTGRVLALAED